MLGRRESPEVSDLGDQQPGDEGADAGNLLQGLGDRTGLPALADLAVQFRELLAEQIQPLQLPVHFPAVRARQFHFFQELPPSRTEG